MTERKPKPRALVVDDEPDIRELLSITLGRMQFEVETAGDMRVDERVEIWPAQKASHHALVTQRQAHGVRRAAGRDRA